VYHGYRGIARTYRTQAGRRAALEESQRFARATLDALEDHMCVLDATGTIVTVNRSWCRFLAGNRGDVTGDFVGADYLAACDNASGDDEASGVAAGAGIRAVLAGENGAFPP
jgi:PAS domain-containing protein